MATIRSFGEALTSACAMIFFVHGAAWADPPLPEISQTGVYRADVVAATEGARIVGSPALAFRDGVVVHYLATSESHERFAANPKAYADVEHGILLALMGADPVLRFPNGVHDLALGAVIAGDTTKYVAEHDGAWFAFATEATWRAFKSNPERYMPPVGAYCLGAMSLERITPGDPNNVFFVPEEQGGTWAVFGSPNGPRAWEAMTPEERGEHLAIAHAYYAERTALAIARAAQR